MTMPPLPFLPSSPPSRVCMQCGLKPHARLFYLLRSAPNSTITMISPQPKLTAKTMAITTNQHAFILHWRPSPPDYLYHSRSLSFACTSSSSCGAPAGRIRPNQRGATMVIMMGDSPPGRQLLHLHKSLLMPLLLLLLLPRLRSQASPVKSCGRTGLTEAAPI
jgi:hypothetical protein